MHKKAAAVLFGAMMWLIPASAGYLFFEEDTTFRNEYIPTPDYDVIADRLSCLEGEVPLNFNNRVYGFINYFSVRDREYTRMILRRSTLYFRVFEKYLEKYELPEELKYLSIVESGLNPRAISRAGAGGLWQFMPYTGRTYRLHQDWYIDERLDFEESTDAACKYLKLLYNMFGDWELALAAYNSGPGNVRKAIRRSGYKKKFWEIYRYLPRETRSYLPQYVAMVYLLNYAPDHNFHEENYEYLMDYDTVRLSNFVNLNVVASELNLCIEDIRLLNPGIKRDALPADAFRYPVRLPSDKIEEFKGRKDEILELAKEGRKKVEYQARNSAGSTFGRDKVVYRVKSGDVLGTIAQKYRVRISDIRKWNNLRSNMIRIGQRLDIWIYPGTKVGTSQTVTRRNVIPEEIPDSKTYVVQPGDTLWDISRKYKGLTIEKIKTLNQLKSNKIHPGQKLRIG